MRLTESDAHEVIGATLYGAHQTRIGKIGQVFFDDITNQPEWITVRTGFFGANESFVPLQRASWDADGVHVPYAKDTIKTAPNLAVDAGHLSHKEERRLFRHYSLDYPTVRTGDVDRVGADRPSGYDTSEPTTEKAMTRSEEQLRVAKMTHETGRARLRKYVVTEQQTITVPVRRQEVRLEREPMTDAEIKSAPAGSPLSEQEHEVVLHEERIVVDKNVVPVQRVRLGIETVTEQCPVTERVRKEQIEVEDPERPRRDRQR